MSELPCLPFWVDAYESDTGHLTDAEDGRYMRLLRLMWRSPECRLPDDDTWLARRLRRAVAEVKSEIRPIIDEFCEVKGGWIVQKRLKKEWEKARNHSDKRRAAANSRWEKEKPPSKSTAPANAPDMQTGMQKACNADATISISKSSSSSSSGSALYDPRARLLKLCEILKTSPATDAAIISRWPEEITQLEADGFDWDKHILPAARFIAERGTKVKSLNYLRGKAGELRIAAMPPPIEIENTDPAGWRKRLSIFYGESGNPELPAGSWVRKWGPKPGEPGCLCPPELMRERMAAE